MALYKLSSDGGVQRTDTGSFIPPDIENKHWREYQAWLAQGNFPDPADVYSPPTKDQKLASESEAFHAFTDYYAAREGILPKDVDDGIKANMP